MSFQESSEYTDDATTITTTSTTTTDKTTTDSYVDKIMKIIIIFQTQITTSLTLLLLGLDIDTTSVTATEVSYGYTGDATTTTPDTTITDSCTNVLSARFLESYLFYSDHAVRWITLLFTLTRLHFRISYHYLYSLYKCMGRY